MLSHATNAEAPATISGKFIDLMFSINFEGKNNVVSIFSIDVDQIFAQYCLALLLNIAQHCWVLKCAAEHYSAERYWTEYYLFNLN